MNAEGKPTKFAMYEDDVRELIERIQDDAPLSKRMQGIITRHALTIMRENEAEHSQPEGSAEE